MKSFFKFFFIAGLIFTFTHCNNKSNAEKTADDIENSVEEAAEETEEGVEDAAEEVEEEFDK